MFSFFSKAKAIPFDFSVLRTDMHSHLLPGIDDGSPDLETSVELVKGMVSLGYKKLVTTPHILWDMYKNTPEIIQGKLTLLREAVAAAHIEVEIQAAAEYFLDDHVENLLKNKEPLLTIKDNIVLTEFSMLHQPFGVKEILFEMQMQGYQPIIAHPERYVYLERDKDFYNELRDAGCLFQLNILSLTGGYGRAVNDLAQYLVKNDFYSYVGTDLHHARHLDGLHNPALVSKLLKLQDSGHLLNSHL